MTPARVPPAPAGAAGAPAIGRTDIADPRVAQRVRAFPESVIREMTRLCIQHKAVNLAQGFPDWYPPDEAIDAAVAAFRRDPMINQYAITWGAPVLRQAIADKARRFNGIEADADKHITVTCGATEAMMAAMLALVDPGDEVVVFEPFYENYGPDAVVSGARTRYVPLAPPAFGFDEEVLKATIGPKTKALVLNTPNNPSGKVFTREELRVIAELCIDHDVVVCTDEIYEHILYDDREHVSIATLPDMADRTVTISGASKTYSMTGWRVAWAIAPGEITRAIRRVHDFLTVGAPHPLQIGVAAALQLPQPYYDGLLQTYTQKRSFTVSMLRRAGFGCQAPAGAYYVMADHSGVAPKGVDDDHAFAEWLVKDVGVAVVPGSSFYSRKALGSHLSRFQFARSTATLEAANAKLEGLVR